MSTLMRSVGEDSFANACRLYKSNSSENEYNEMVPNFKDNYLASNLDFIREEAGERVPMAPRFKKFTTKNQGIRILAFGFIFDFKGNSNNTVVLPVADTAKEQWFQDAIRDKEVDLILVAGHVAIRSPEYTTIYDAIRSVQWDTPIQFFGGHSHIRDYKKYDKKAYALESGRYMETIGFQSITGLSTNKKAQVKASPTFARRYIDNNLFSYYHHTGLNETTMPTELGKNVSAQIHAARKELKLDHTFGCAPRDLWTNRVPYPDEASIFSWLDSRVVPDQVVDPKRASKPRIVVGNTGAMRFDIFEGPFTIDTTFIISPFTSGFRYIKDVPYALADRVLTILNNKGPIFEHAGMEVFRLVAPEQMTIASDVVAGKVRQLQFDIKGNRQIPLGKSEDKLTPGYTTKDDAGEDGDDTIHSKISSYKVPNCFEARVNTTSTVDGKEEPVETVDMVYLEFIEPWMILALKFLGGAYDLNSTLPYAGGKDFTTMIAEWVKDNWNGEC